MGIGATAWTDLCAWWAATYPIAGFASLIQLAFGANIAYAVLVRAGAYQGVYLSERADAIHKNVQESLDLLKAEGQFKDFDIAGDALRAGNIVSESQVKIRKFAIAFAAISIVAALVSLLFLYVIGIKSDWKIGALTTVFFSFFLFIPIPVGLGFTYFMVSKCEDKVKNVYKWLSEAVSHVNAMPQEKTQIALNNLQKMLAQKSDGMWKRIFMHGSRDN